MKQKHRDIIRTFIDDDIRELCIYSGYKGGIVLKISTISVDFVNRLQDYCMSIDVECNVKHNRNLAAYDIFCVVEDDEIYCIKDATLFR